MKRFILPLLALLGSMQPVSVPRFSFPLGYMPAPLIRQGRVSGVRAVKRLARKRLNQRRARNV